MTSTDEPTINTLSDDARVILLPPESPIVRRWTVRRRIALLIVLLLGLGIALTFIPPEAWTAFFAAQRTQGTLVGMLSLFALITVSLVWSAGQRLDTKIFLFFNLHWHHYKWVDHVMWAITQLGNMAAALVLAGLLFVLNYQGQAFLIVLGTLTLWLVVELIKILADRARPFLDLEGARVIGWRERGRSFPSGHTTQTFFLATLLSHQFQLDPIATLALYTLAALIGISRVYVGAHYPRDVMAGAVLGSIWGVLATLVDPRWLTL